MAFVVDASITLTWAFRDEADERADIGYGVTPLGCVVNS
jgi:hypothetical protein